MKSDFILPGNQLAMDRVEQLEWYHRTVSKAPWQPLDVSHQWHRIHSLSEFYHPYAIYHTLQRYHQERSRVKEENYCHIREIASYTNIVRTRKIIEMKEKILWIILTCDTKMPGSWVPNGTHEWSVPPIILNPNGPWFLGNITS